jgi:hypothetical protein
LKKLLIGFICSFVGYGVIRQFFGYASGYSVDLGKCGNFGGGVGPDCSPGLTIWGRVEPFVEVGLMIITIVLFVLFLKSLSASRTTKKP